MDARPSQMFERIKVFHSKNGLNIFRISFLARKEWFGIHIVGKNEILLETRLLCDCRGGSDLFPSVIELHVRF